MNAASILTMLRELCEMVIDYGSHIGCVLIIGVTMLVLGVSVMFSCSETFKQSDIELLNWTVFLLAVACAVVIVLFVAYIILDAIGSGDEN